jgi:ADP-ribosyltransferase exoenzyme
VITIVTDDQVMIRFSPDQPRDEHGRFGEGGGSGGDFKTSLDSAATGAAALQAVPYGKGDGNPRTDAALTNYAESGYAQINADLRAGTTDSPETADRIAALDAAMQSSQLTQDVVVGRGIRDPEDVFGDAWNNTDVTGLTFTDRGFVSTTTNPAQIASGRNFQTGSNGAFMRIVLPQGTSALAIGKNETSPFSEKEIILDRGLTYRVVADNGVNEDGTRMLDVEVAAGG